MKYIRRISLYLPVVAAVGAIAAPAASAALPEFVGPMPQPLTSTLKASTLETVGGLKITCTGGTNAGQLTGPKALTVSIKFTGCILNGLPCSSGAAAGEIDTPVLSGTLAYISAPKKLVGIDLSQPGGPLMQFVYGEDLSVVVLGSVIGRITPINKEVLPPRHFTLKFAQKTGKQKFTKFEGGPLDIPRISVLGGPLEEAGLAAGDLIRFAAPVAVVA